MIAALLGGEPPPLERVVAMVRESRAAARHRAGDADLPSADIDCCAMIDAFDFAMRAERRGG